MKFNPLTDLTLSQRDTAVRQLGGITETEISSLASSLRTASQRTGQIVDVLRRDNKKTNSDLNKIRDLDRRLKRVIPIIPERFGEAGNIYADRQPIPEGGFQFPRIKFPKFPKPGGPIKVPDPGPVTVPEYSPVPDTVDQPDQLPVDPDLFPQPGIPGRRPETTPGFPGIPIPGPGIPIPVPILRFAKDFNSGLDKLASTMNDFFEKNPSATLAMDLSMGGGARSAYGVATGTLFPLGRRALASILTRTNPQLAQRIFRPRGGFVPASPITSTYGTKIGPQPAPVKLPTPPPITAAKVAPRTPAVPAPATNLYEQLLKSRGFGISSMGQVGRPLGGKRSLMRAPFMKRFDAGGIFRQGTVPKEVYAMRRALRDIGLEEELARIADPRNPQSQVAKREVLEQLGLVDETFERIMGGGTKIPKKTVVKPREQLLGPERFLMQGPEVDTVLGALETPLARIQPGTIADFIGLSHPEVRLDFLKYIAGIKNTKSGQRNYKMIEKLLRQTGMYVKMGKDGVIPMDDDVLGFVLNFYKKKGIDPRPFLQKMKENGLLEGGIEGLKTNKAKSVRDAYQFLKEMEQNKTVLPLPENYKVPPGGPQSSVMGRPRSMDIASLGIDTSVEIQEIYYIVG